MRTLNKLGWTLLAAVLVLTVAACDFQVPGIDRNPRFSDEVLGPVGNEWYEKVFRAAVLHPPQWSPDGSHIALASTSRPIAIRIGSTGLVARRYDGVVYSFRADGSEVRRLSPEDEPGFEHRYFSPSFSPDGTQIVFTTSRHLRQAGEWLEGQPIYERNFEIESSDIEGSNTMRLTVTNTDSDVIDERGWPYVNVNASPRWSPDGTRIAFFRVSDYGPEGSFSGKDSGIYVMAADGADVRRIVATREDVRDDYLVNAALIRAPAWSPSGEMIAFVTTGARLYTVAEDGSGLARLQFAPEPFYSVSNPAWSPGGEYIALGAYHSYEGGVYLVRPDGTDSRKILSDLSGQYLEWSPDGKSILVSAVLAPYQTDEQHHQAIVIELAASYDEPTIRTLPVYGLASWSPDGSHITAYDSTTGILATIKNDGTDWRAIAQKDEEFGFVSIPRHLQSNYAGELCSDGNTVPEPADNVELVRDCEALLSLANSMGLGADVWNAHRPISTWQGITIGEAPHRVHAIDLMGNTLNDGSLSSSLGQLTELRELRLSGLSLVGAIPPAIGQLTKLSHLDLSMNQLSGPIPGELSALSGLTYLNLSSNKLSGAIPPDLGQLSELGGFYLGGNELSGKIPTTLSRLQGLEFLWLNDNQLGGEIPRALGQMSYIYHLDLSGNQLTGSIPGELGQAPRLALLYLNNNQLSGSIPSELAEAQWLNVIRARSNNLSGCIPLEFSDIRVEATGLERCLTESSQ